MPGEAKVADPAAINQIDTVTETLARGAPGSAEDSVQFTAVERVCLDAENGADDVRTMLDDGGVLGNRVDELHGAAIDATEASQRRDVSVEQDLSEELCRKLVELADGKTRRDGRVTASHIVERTSCRQLRIV